jgi:metallophosphoesterase (TIGR00282 family)
MIILYFGDIFGKAGRRAVATALPQLRAKYRPDFIFGNAENLAGGKGANMKTLREVFELGFHGFTSGNHIWDNKEILMFFQSDSRVLRPANYPNSQRYQCPGSGSGVYRNSLGQQVCLLNLQGRVFMDAIDCPFAAADRELLEVPESLPVIVDFHAEATSEKNAMGWYLNGRVAAVLGTHTHIQTADERLLSGETAYITDIGMSGSFDSVIGLAPQEILVRYVTRRPNPYKMAKENPGVCCVVIRLQGRKAIGIERLRIELGGAATVENAEE